MVGLAGVVKTKSRENRVLRRYQTEDREGTIGSGEHESGINWS